MMVDRMVSILMELYRWAGTRSAKQSWVDEEMMLMSTGIAHAGICTPSGDACNDCMLDARQDSAVL